MSIETKTKKDTKLSQILKFEVSFGTTSLVQKASFAKNLAVMLKSGLTINQSLAIAGEQARGRFKRILDKILKSVESGNTLSDSLADFPSVFSSLFVKVVFAGEQAGRLDENLESIAKQLEKDKELETKIKGAMMYPMVIFAVTIILGLAIALLVLPKITPLLKALNVPLPLSTRLLIGFADLVSTNGVILFPLIIAGLMLFIWFLKRKFMQPMTHWIILHMPVVSVISRNTNLARFCRTLGTLLQSGLNIDDAVNIAKETLTNIHYKNALTKVAKQVGEGVEFSTSLERYANIFPVMLIRMVSVGERSGKIEELLFYLADFYDIEVEGSTKTLSTALEPMLLLVIGVIVAVLAMAIITPIYQVTGNISGS
jgi:type II secretory pathway component PulF